MCAHDENFFGSFRSQLLANDVCEAFAFRFKTLPSRRIAGRGEGHFDVLGCSTEGRIMMNVSGPDLDRKAMDIAFKSFRSGQRRR
jgi:hypothetical protein